MLIVYSPHPKKSTIKVLSGTPKAKCSPSSSRSISKIQRSEMLTATCLLCITERMPSLPCLICKDQYEYLIEFKKNETSDNSNTAYKDLLRTYPMSHQSNPTTLAAESQDKKSNRATMSTERIDYLIEDSGAGMRKDYAQSLFSFTAIPQIYKCFI